MLHSSAALMELPTIAESPELAVQAALLVCREISHDSNPNEDRINGTLNEMDAMTTFIAVEANDMVVATAGLDVSHPTDPDEADIINLAVVSERHKRGLGRAMIEMVAERAREQDVKRLYAWATPSSVGFYEKLDFLRLTNLDYVKVLSA